MSAPKKKTAKLTEKQRQMRAEEKKLKLYTIAFVTVLVLVVCLAVGILVNQKYVQSGIAEKTTIAATVGGHEINTVEMAYYYSDAINNFYNSVYSSGSYYGETFIEDYFAAIGLDLTKKLTEQINPETGDTWANYFVDAALETAQNDYAIADLAQKAGYTLPAEEKAQLDVSLANIQSTAVLYGYGSANKYLQAIYGNGASEESYRTYLERSALANAYYTYYNENLTFTADDISAHETEKGANTYNSYTYLDCYLSYTDFLEGGTKDENGKVTYTKEEEDAARAKMKTVAEQLAKAKDADELKKLASEADINETSQLAVNQETNKSHSALSADLANWLASDDRKAGEVGMIENKATTEGNPINGYHVVIFQSKNDNTEKMDNVRHVLISYEGGHTDETTGETVYTDAEKAVAMNEAKKLLDQWKSGDATKETFIEMVKEHSGDTASVEDGGLYADIHHSSEYMESFRTWAIDPERKVGDTGLVETDYGVHIMYYDGNSELSYREHMITEELRAAALEKWHNEALEATKVVKKDLSKLNMAVALS